MEDDLKTLTADIVSAFVSNNRVATSELPGLIEATFAALSRTAQPASVPAEEFTPAVSVRKSLANPDHLISMIDGKPYRMLRRHLSQNGLTPEQYRERYKLPADYPLVAPSYAETRRALAKKIGLGTKSRGQKKA